MRLIDADVLKDELRLVYENVNEYSKCEIAEMISRVDMQNTVEYVQAKHGRWIRPEGIYTSYCSIRWQCTICKKIATQSHGENRKKFKTIPKCTYSYCPNCGAIMELQGEY